MGYLTYQDCVDHVVDYLGSNPGDAVQRDARRAIQAAYRDVVNAHSWSYLMRVGRVVTNAVFSNTGTIQYQHTSGTYPRQVTLTGAMWPNWAANGVIRVGLVSYRVATVISATVLTLDPIVNPGMDIAAGTSFILYQDTYVLPSDFISADEALYEMNFGGMTYVSPKEIMFEERYIFAQGVPQIFTIQGDQQYPGRMTIKIAPFPSDTKTIDFIYKRRARPMAIQGPSAGTISVAQNGTAVTGVGTAWTPSMVGSVFRASLTPGVIPTGYEGANPPDFEAQVQSWTDATHITVDTPAPATFTNAKHIVSDWVDFELGAMQTVLLRGLEAQIGKIRRMKDMPDGEAAYKQALKQAKSTDSRSFMGLAEGDHRPFRQRLRDMPIDFSMDS